MIDLNHILLFVACVSPLVMLAQFTLKVGVEVLFTPVTYKIVNWLKREEHEDYYDRKTNFNPFHLKD